MRRSRVLFHPVFVLTCAAVAIALYAATVRWRVPSGDIRRHLLYVLPIIVPCVAFLFDRAARFRTEGWPERATDFAVMVAAILRALGLIPMISGHALFLTYAIARPGSWLTKISALVVMFQVLYLKYFVWGDSVTPSTGIAVGLTAALIVRGLGARMNPRSLPALPNSE
jgi:hypothetical protein